MSGQRVLHVLRQVAAEAVGLLHPGLERGGGIGNDQAPQPLRLQHGVFRGQHAAPGLTDEVIAVGDAEMLEQAVEFAQEEIDRPEIGALVAQMGGASVSQLVVVDDSATGGSEALEGVDVIVGAAGAAMQHHQRRLAASEVAGHPVPGAAERALDIAFSEIH
jgi:hypothetical protein